MVGMKSVLLALLLLLLTLAGIFLGFATLVATATVTATSALFLLAGLTAFCLTNCLGLLLVTRKIEAVRRNRIRVSYFAGSTAVVVVFFVVTALLPMGDPQLAPAVVEGQQSWDLPTGSRIAYVRLPAEGNAHDTPVIFLHGGPGVPDMKGDSEYFGKLIRDGFDVYVYDEVGSGRSSRLDDPRDYTLGRDVSDLEAIRQKIGAEKVVLIGHSYGGVLAAAYAASHGEHVSKMVLSSPGDPSPSVGGASMLGRLSTREKLGVYTLLLPPRPMLAYALLQVNPEAARAFAGDSEMDARQDRVYNRTRPALHCEGEPPGPKLHGLGFYANQYPQSAARSPHEDFLPALARRDMPTLITKGSCDYLSWSSAVDYLRTLSDARLVYLRGAGHNAYQDMPERYMAVVRTFLKEQRLPQEPYTGERPLEDYEGPS